MKPSRSDVCIPYRMTTLSLFFIAAGLLTLSQTSLAQTKNKAAAPVKSSAAKEVVQVVKPPIALAYIDVATSASDMPGGNLMAGAAQGAQSGGDFLAL